MGGEVTADRDAACELPLRRDLRDVDDIAAMQNAEMGRGAGVVAQRNQLRPRGIDEIERGQIVEAEGEHARPHLVAEPRAPHEAELIERVAETKHRGAGELEPLGKLRQRQLGAR